MIQLSLTEVKKLTASQIKEKMPFEVTADGVVIATISRQAVGRTKCPNCKLEYNVIPPDGRPYFFTMKHPK